MRLSEKQALFLELWTGFMGWALHWADTKGYYLVERTGYVLPKLMPGYIKHYGGHPRSLHGKALAKHLLIFDADTHQPIWNPDAYDELGAAWKACHVLARYGGDFASRDAVHFSIEHGDMA